MKKRVLSALVVVLLFVSSFAMVACGGKKVQTKDVFKQTTEFFEFLDKSNIENNMFQTSTIVNVESKYVISYFNKGEKKYNYYNQVLINPMNFISTYQTDLQRLNEIKISSSKNEIVNDYSSNMKDLKASYLKTTIQYERLQSFSQTSGVIIEGAEQLFVNELKYFINDAYETAQNLALIKNEILNDYSSLTETVEKMSATQSASLKDYVALKLGSDVSKTLLNKLNINKINTSSSDPNVSLFVTKFVNPLYATLNKISLLQSKVSFKEIGDAITKKVDDVVKVVGYKNQEVVSLLNNLKFLSNEREYFFISTDRFDLYNFYQSYGCSIEACAKKVENAENYYTQIINYTSEIIPTFADYFLAILVV